jgi:hypothetical protein
LVNQLKHLKDTLYPNNFKIMCKHSHSYDIPPVFVTLAIAGGVMYATQALWGAMKYATNKAQQVINRNTSDIKQIQKDVTEIKQQVNELGMRMKPAQ